jgi:CheY-like chemotaxis protein
MPNEFSEESGATRRGRILLVEDNEAASRGLARLLEAQGFEVTTVSDGESALRALDASPPPDVLLTDMQLPDLDGRELALHARQLAPSPANRLDHRMGPGTTASAPGVVGSRLGPHQAPRHG